MIRHLDDGDDAVGRLALEANADARLARVAARSLEGQGDFREGGRGGRWWGALRE